MRTAVAVLALCFSASLATGDEYKVRFTAKGSLPAFKSIVLVPAGSHGPGDSMHESGVTKLDQPIIAKDAGPFDVWWVPKSGLPVLIKAGTRLDSKEEAKIVVDDYLGAVSLRGDDQPRGKLVIAPQDDPGVGEKGHKPIQTGSFRDELVAPDGFYSMWLVPDNGARPRRIIDRFRVLAGKSVLLD